MGLGKWLSDYIIRDEIPKDLQHLCDFDKILQEIRPGDVILVEGHSLASRVIQQVTLSPWSHSFIYIGRFHQIEDKCARKIVETHPGINPDDKLIIEGYLGQGIIFNTIDSYADYHLRICRPRGLSRNDAQNVISSAIKQVGYKYDLTQVLDLARFLLPWSFLPKSWRSSLFSFKAGEQTKTVCSTMVATAFQSVQFPILPIIKVDKNGEVELYQRNPKLFTPRDFDYSPYFDIIKYPFIDHADPAVYRYLPWAKSSGIYTDETTLAKPTETTTLEEDIKPDEIVVEESGAMEAPENQKPEDKQEDKQEDLISKKDQNHAS